jgi:hypothetical protein
VTLARTGVEYDYRSEVIDAPAPEIPPVRKAARPDRAGRRCDRHGAGRRPAVGNRVTEGYATKAGHTAAQDNIGRTTPAIWQYLTDTDTDTDDIGGGYAGRRGIKRTLGPAFVLGGLGSSAAASPRYLGNLRILPGAVR